MSELKTPEPKPAVTLRPREAVLNQRKAEIVRALRDAAEANQPVELAWIEELAELVGVDLRRR
jgi:predicted N-acetyltransferase YhbS